MRVFVGVRASGQIQNEVEKWQKEHRHIPVRFLKGKNLHITLIPPWYKKNAVKAINRFKKFNWDGGKIQLYFNKILYAPSSKPRLIWVEGTTPKELLNLQKNLLSHFKKQEEKRALKLHMTLARFKKQDFPTSKLTSKFPKINQKVRWQMEIERITLFESKLSRLGAEYEVIIEKSFIV